jgi:hypothetical protein
MTLRLFAFVAAASVLWGCSNNGTSDVKAPVGAVTTSKQGAAEAAANGGVPKPRPKPPLDVNR